MKTRVVELGDHCALRAGCSGGRLVSGPGRARGDRRLATVDHQPGHRHKERHHVEPVYQSPLGEEREDDGVRVGGEEGQVEEGRVGQAQEHGHQAVHQEQARHVPRQVTRASRSNVH
eukprot:CAMPEP_0113940348 /NCGR_PEP_ID=MMETSP1339-20121228/6498_1 /TAXON_ID=94617 /ORGANISM="Fibrocapsa japonica" /LENGTH=116 /DNA_ID=CAMNT_0000944151 /DNA_START=40 /DNA_END=390 /DNA_ORIENTATION=+ /assembly_acc=CAM_ASM_000762